MFEGREEEKAAGPAADRGRPPHPERLLDGANDAVIVTEGWPIDGPGPRVVYANAAFTRTTGYSSEEIVGKSPRVLQGPGTDRAKLDGIRAALEAGDPIRTEILNYRKDGSPYWVELSIAPVRDEAGRIERWLSVQRETTARVEAEGARLEAERRLRSVLARYGSDMVTILEPDGTPRYESPAVERALGYRHKELAAGDVFRFVHPDDVEGISRSVAEALKTPGESPPVEFRMRHADGSWRWLESSKNNLSGDPEVGGIVVVTREVTGRKEAERALREAEERYRLLVEQIPAVTYVDRYVDPRDDGRDDEPVYVSPQIEGMLGYAPEEWVGKRLWPQKLHPDDRERVLAADARFERDEDGGFGEEYRLFAKNGEVVWVREEAAVVRDGEGRPLLWQGIMLDVTERKEAEEALRRSEARLGTVARSAPVILFALDAEGVFTFEEGAALGDVGVEPGERVGRTVFEAYPDHPDVWEDVRRALSGEEVVATVEMAGRAYHATYSPQRDGRGRVTGVIGVATDVTERKGLEEELRRRALHDDLTGLPNRALFFDRLEHALKRARRGGDPTALLFVDVDGFKAVNDALGHRAGDELLAGLSRRLEACVRPSDTVARLGGDEFAVLLERCPPERADEIAERIEQESDRPFAVGGREARISASVGRAYSTATDVEEGVGAARLLSEADRAMYARKKRRPGRSG